MIQCDGHPETSEATCHNALGNVVIWRGLSRHTGSNSAPKLERLEMWVNEVSSSSSTAAALERLFPVRQPVEQIDSPQLQKRTSGTPDKNPLA